MKTMDTFATQKFAIYILGGGFSKLAGLPLASELWKEVLRRALAMTGRARFFRDDLEAYIEYRKRCDGIVLTFDTVNLEEFMAFLDVEFHLGLRGKETWSSHGNEAQVVVKTLIGGILADRTPAKIPELYLDFAKLLKPDDYVLTFNYDVLLERALEQAGVAYRLYPNRYRPTECGSNPKMMVVDDSREEVIVLKPHGSIDWFDRAEYSAREQDRIDRGFESGGRDLVFEDQKRFNPIPLVEGPRFANDPLREMHRVKNLEALYQNMPLFLATPALLNPSSMKILFAEMVRDFWWGMGYAGGMSFRMAIIGFSLPPQDEYARQVIYRLVTNYQATGWNMTWDDAGHKKSPVTLIDFRQSSHEQEQFKQRYAFVDWNKARTCFDGLDEHALQVLASS